MNEEDRKMLRDVHFAVCGSEQLHVKGLGERVEIVEDRQDRLDTTVAKWGGIATGVSAAVSIALNFILRGHK